MSIFKREEVISSLDKQYKSLFDAFKKTDRFKEKGMDKRTNRSNNVEYDVLTKEDLAAIEDLTIDTDSDLSYINKIEVLCPNLKSLTINTRIESCVYGKQNAEIAKFPVEERRKKLEDFYGRTKLTDENMYHIQKLTKLEELRIPSQTRITELDFSKMPNLKIVMAKDCTNLRVIKGMNNNLFTTNYATYDFTGCEKLNGETFKMFSDLFDAKNYDGEKLTPGHLFLPLGCSIRKENDLNNFVEYAKSVKYGTVLFSQSSRSKSLLINHYAKDIAKYCEKLDEIIAEVCNPQKTDLKNIKGLYSWIRDNICYDKATIEKEHENWEEINQIRIRVREASKNRSERTRSAYYTLKKQVGVCVGISALFCDLVTRANFKTVEYARQVHCSSKKVEQGLLATSTHSISAIKFKNVGEYYFDPTFDLDNFIPMYFAKNKEEISERFSLAFSENYVENAPSIFNRNNRNNKVNVNANSKITVAEFGAQN